MMHALCIPRVPLRLGSSGRGEPAGKYLPEGDLGGIGKFAFGDRTIPIHARTLGFVVTPHEMGMYYGTV